MIRQHVNQRRFSNIGTSNKGVLWQEIFGTFINFRIADYKFGGINFHNQI
jgi:hypothetical protein